MADALLDRICDQYLNSGDFNGLYFSAANGAEHAEAMTLVRDGLVEVVSEKDYPNPSIRPWPVRRSVDVQLASITELADGHSAVCLYPTASSLHDRVVGLFPDRPFAQRMAEGRGTLELAYFDFAVLEQYRNDPRFLFRFDDFGADAIIGDDAYLD